MTVQSFSPVENQYREEPVPRVVRQELAFRPTLDWGDYFMDFIDKLQALASRIEKQKDRIETEEATKQAFILPFIQILGYDIWNPDEVVPEFVADVGIKKGEKIDYAILQDGKPIMLIEAKKAGAPLNLSHSSQLFRYFHVVEARVAILTNGVHYQFFTDVDDKNKMDSKPFLELDMLSLKEAAVERVKSMAKESFNVDNLLDAAVELKYTKQIRHILAEQFENPDEEFVKFFGKRVYEGMFTQAVKEQFTELTRKAFRQFVNEQFDDRLSLAFGDRKHASAETEAVEAPPEPAADNDDGKPGVETTEDELQGFMMVKAILAQVVPLDRVVARDTKTYFGVLLDDNNRKPLCRLWLNRSQWYLGVFDAEKNEDRLPIEKLDDIYQHAEKIKAAVEFYD
jgi:predicted type IV restriction endonuclease